MVDANSLLNISDIPSVLWEGMQPSISPLITIFKAVGIAILVYILFLILRAVLRWRTTMKVSDIAKDVHQINL